MTPLPRRVERPRRLVTTLLLSFAAAIAATPTVAADTAGADTKAADTKTDSETKPTYTLRYKLRPGDTLRYEVDHQASVRSTMEGSTQKALTRSQSIKAWKVTDVAPPSEGKPGGEIELLHTVERVRMTNKLPEQAEQTYDSKQDATAPPGFEDAAKAIGVPLSKVRITPWGKLVAREELHHQPAADPSAPITVLLPEAPVAIGESWDEPQDITVRLTDGEGVKAIKTRRHMTLRSVKGGVALIKAQHQVLTPVTPPIEAQLAQRLMSGTIRFHLAEGRILSQQMDVDKRVLGFAGQTSSMHYVMRMKERLIPTPAKVASRDTSRDAAHGDRNDSAGAN